MSGGSKKQTTQTTQKNDPYAPSAPALQTIIDQSLAAFNSGAGGNVYGGPRVAGAGATTQAGQDFLTRNANAGLGTAQAADRYVGGLIGSGGATADTTRAVGGLLGVGPTGTDGLARAAARSSDPNGAGAQVSRGLIGGDYALDGSGYADLNAGLAGPSQVQRSLQAVADGKYLGRANPYLDSIVGQSNDDAVNRVKNSFSASGRYGSGMFSGAVADAVSRNENTLRYQDYDAERGRQAQAAQAIDQGLLARTSMRQGLLGAQNDVRSANAGQAVTGANLGMAGDAAALQGQQALFGANAANAAQRIGQYTTALGAGQADRAAAMGAVGAVPGIQDSLLQPGRTLAGVGAAQDFVRQQELAAAQDVFNEKDNALWRRLGLLSGTTLPVAGAGGTSQGTEVRTVPQPGILQQMIGLALAGADTASKFYGK